MAATLMLEKGTEPVPGYFLEHLLGSGGWGEVWKAHRADGSKLALKFLPCDSHAVAAQEVRALQAIRQIEHPNLIRLDKVWCCSGFVVVGMELAEGSLLDLLRISQEEFGTPVSAETTCFLLSQAALALDFLNTRQHLVDGERVAFRHCDVKPGNILLKGKQVKLADFSLAVRTTAAFWHHSQAGTPIYSAPEVRHGCLSETTDQYALAVTYCQVRGGRLPFATVMETTPVRWNGAATDSVPPVPDLTMLLPAERPIIARALAQVPLDRWPSCATMMERLEKTLNAGKKKACPV